MLKRVIPVLAALILLCAGASAEGTLADIPLSAADCPVRPEDIIPLCASDVALPEAVRYLPEDMPHVSGQDRDEDYEYFILTAKPDILPEVALTRSPADRWRLTSYSGELALLEDGRYALRYAAHEDAMHRLSLTYTYSEQGYDEEIVIVYDSKLNLFEEKLVVTFPERKLTYLYDDEERLSALISESASWEFNGLPANYEAYYGQDGTLSSMTVTANQGTRSYRFFGLKLWEIWDKPNRMTVHYDEESGLMTSYDLYRISTEYPMCTEDLYFSCYGTVIWAEFPNGEDDNEVWFWVPGIGWHISSGRGPFGVFPEASAHLPDLAAITPPLPAQPLPEYRLDARSVSELPPLPVPVDALPQITDWREEGEQLLLTLDGPLPEGYQMRVRYEEELESYSTRAIAAEPVSGLTYTVTLPSKVTPGDLTLELCRQALDVSSFTVMYTRSLDGAWSAMMTSPAADIGYTLDDEGRVVEAVIYNHLSGLRKDFYLLTFDGETGALTRYDYSVSLPFASAGTPYPFGNGEYTITYVPGEGIVTATYDDDSWGLCIWSPEAGWMAPDGGEADFLYNPLDFPHTYPFPTDS